MTTEDITKLFGQLGLPFAYDHFAEGESPAPPFAIYRYPRADNFAADGTAYFKQNILHIELYTDKKEPMLEEKIEAALEARGIFYGKGEVWIDREDLYEIMYEMEVTA